MIVYSSRQRQPRIGARFIRSSAIGLAGNVFVLTALFVGCSHEQPGTSGTNDVNHHVLPTVTTVAEHPTTATDTNADAASADAASTDAASADAASADAASADAASADAEGVLAVDTESPRISVDHPNNGVRVEVAEIPIVGRIDDANATLTVDGQPVRVGADGNFVIVVPLSVGRNEIRLVATNHHRTTIHTHTVFRYVLLLEPSNLFFIAQFLFPDEVIITNVGSRRLGDVIEKGNRRYRIVAMNYAEAEIIIEDITTGQRHRIVTAARYRMWQGLRQRSTESSPSPSPDTPPESSSPPPTDTPTSADPAISNLFFIAQFSFPDEVIITNVGPRQLGNVIEKGNRRYRIVAMNYAEVEITIEDIATGRRHRIFTQAGYRRHASAQHAERVQPPNDRNGAERGANGE